MLNYIIRRLMLMVPTLLGITLLVFLVMGLAPGGVAAALLSAEGAMRPQEREAMRAYLNQRYGLDKPLLVQYGRWLNQVSPVGFRTYQPDDAAVLDGRRQAGHVQFTRPVLRAPNLGESFLRRRPVLAVIGEALPVTLLLNVITIPIIYAVSITVGIRAARQRGKTFDVASGTLLIALWSMPTMWVGVMAVGFLASARYLGWFPIGGLHDTMAPMMSFLPSWGAGGFERGWLLDTMWHLVLPVACLTYGGFAFLTKLMRAAVLENLSADFARTARAKGLSERIVLYRHVLRNSILPLITVAAGILPGLLGGSLIVENIFSINGMGTLMIEGIRMRDRELILAQTLVVGFISLVSLLIADICYAIADPRVSYE
jgi:microcin C transport system permease protein